jgi:hypothetical protein
MGVDISELGAYRRLLDEKYGELEVLLADLPADALLWKPFEQSPWQGECNPLGMVIAHAISSTVYLFRQAEYAAGKIEWQAVDGDEGREEFGPANHQPGYLLARVRRTQAFAHHVLAELSPTDLGGSRAHPKRSERIFTVRYAIQHAIEHLSQHIGHAQLTRQLWALQHG